MKIRKLRVTWTVTSVLPVPFATASFASSQQLVTAWGNPSALALAGLDWTHPWTDANSGPVGPDRNYWASVLEVDRLTDDVTDAFRNRLVRYAVPLRASAKVDVVDEPRISTVFAEVLLEPWAATGAVTATLTFPEAIEFAGAADAVAAVRNSKILSIDQLPGVVSPTELAQHLAMLVTTNMKIDHEMAITELPVSSIATVIDAELPDQHVDAVADAAFCDAMHRLAGANVPGLDFEWLRVAGPGGMGCVRSELRRVLTTGVAQWAQGALIERPQDPLAQTGGIHRNAVLGWATYSSLRGLLQTDWPDDDPDWFLQLRDVLRNLFRRYYAPAAGHRDWMGQAYVDLNGIEGLLDDPVATLTWRCSAVAPVGNQT